MREIRGPNRSRRFSVHGLEKLKPLALLLLREVTLTA